MNLFIISSSVLLLLSCNAPDKKDGTKQETPKALQDKNLSEIDMISKRGSDDMVESLYAELVNSDLKLKNLEKDIEELKEQKTDSLKLFTKYNGRSVSYYESANNHLNQIQDSSLRFKTKLILKNSRNTYDHNISAFTTMIGNLDDKDVSLDDLHAILKIIITLPLIEKFQKENYPSTIPLDKVLKEYEKTIKRIDTVVNN